MAPPSRSGPKPLRALAALAAIVVIMLISILGKETFSPGNWQDQFKVGLGLDLSSGTQVVLQAVTHNGKPPDPGEMQQAIAVLESRVNGTGNSGAEVQQQGTDLLEVSVPGKAPQDVVNLVSSTAQLSFRPVLLEAPYAPTVIAKPASLSVAHGSTGTFTLALPSKPAKNETVTIAASGNKGLTASPKSLTFTPANFATPQTVTVTANATGTGTATFTASSTDFAPATVTAAENAVAPAAANKPPITYGNASLVNAANTKLFDTMVCVPGPNSTTTDPSWKTTVGYTAKLSQWDDGKAQIVSCDPSGFKYVLGPAVFVGKDVDSVNAGLLQNTTQWAVNFTLNSPATSAFRSFTETQYNSYYAGYQGGNQNDMALDSFAMVLDGNVVSAPTINSVIPSGQVQITGGGSNGFTQQQATDLANVLKYGSLPLTFVPQSVNGISAQLGHNSLDAGLIAAIIGLGLVVLYSFIYYRGLGLVSVSSLLIAALLAYLSVVLLSTYQNFTMSLSAIAGLVVAIGITADSFIVFFERLRDEVRDGKTLRPAVESGWRRARRTILVSDTVSFLAAVLLYKFAVSDVQGFAYTLGLTTLIDVLVVFLFTKPMVTVLARTKFYGGGHRWSGLDPERLGAKTLWRSSTRRVVRTQRTASGARSSSASSSTTSREA